MTSSTSCKRPSADRGPPFRLHGRRRGRALSTRQRRLLAEVLPRLAVPETATDPGTLFPAAREIRLEIGFGTGEHLVHQASLHPDVGFIGCEPFVAGLAACLGRIVDGGLGNVRLHADDARPLLVRLRPACLARVDLLFPDPWPKARHRERRFVTPATLDMIARVLAPGGAFRVATDDPDYAADALAAILRHGAYAWDALHAADWRRPADAGPPSRCEAKAAAAGRPAVYLAFRRLSG